MNIDSSIVSRNWCTKPDPTPFSNLACINEMLPLSTNSAVFIGFSPKNQDALPRVTTVVNQLHWGRVLVQNILTESLVKQHLHLKAKKNMFSKFQQYWSLQRTKQKQITKDKGIHIDAYQKPAGYIIHSQILNMVDVHVSVAVSVCQISSKRG